MDESIDRWVWYAGWADKYAQVVGSTNPVAGPYFNFSLPEPTGVVGVLAPQDSSLLGLVSVVAPVLATGNTAVVVASQARPLPAVSLAEVLATSDLPGGVVNLLTGFTAELAPWLACHRDVNAIDLTGVGRARRAPTCSERRPTTSSGSTCPRHQDWAADPGIGGSPRSSRRRPSGTRSASDPPGRARVGPGNRPSQTHWHYLASWTIARTVRCSASGG